VVVTQEGVAKVYEVGLFRVGVLPDRAACVHEVPLALALLVCFREVRTFLRKPHPLNFSPDSGVTLQSPTWRKMNLSVIS
jgi:hypothetical protein